MPHFYDWFKILRIAQLFNSRTLLILLFFRTRFFAYFSFQTVELINILFTNIKKISFLYWLLFREIVLLSSKRRETIVNIFLFTWPFSPHSFAVQISWCFIFFTFYFLFINWRLCKSSVFTTFCIIFVGCLSSVWYWWFWTYTNEKILLSFSFLKFLFLNEHHFYQVLFFLCFFIDCWHFHRFILFLSIIYHTICRFKNLISLFDWVKVSFV